MLFCWLNELVQNQLVVDFFFSWIPSEFVYNWLWFISWLDSISILDLWFRWLPVTKWSSSNVRYSLDWFNIGYWWLSWHYFSWMGRWCNWSKKFIACNGYTANCKHLKNILIRFFGFLLSLSLSRSKNDGVEAQKGEKEKNILCVEFHRHTILVLSKSFL